MGEKEARLRAALSGLRPLNEKAMQQARHRQQRLAKPPGSLGVLEEIAVRLAGITGQSCPDARNARLIVMCADNGVVAQGVTHSPQSVTKAQSINLAQGGAGAAVLCKSVGADLLVVDVGICGFVGCKGILNRKIREGTGDIFKGPAMTREQCIEAITVGMECACQSGLAGYTLLGAGEMGVGNTTTSAAVLSVLTGAPPADTVGRGSGITDATLAKKRAVVQSVVARERACSADVMETLTRVGGLDLAAMTGLYLGAAQNRIPIVIDGLISAVAALCAQRLAPASKAYMFASHESAETGYRIAIRALGLDPMLRLGMHLGEGSGCPLAFGIIRAACDLMRDMATFEQAQINDDYYEPVRKEAQ